MNRFLSYFATIWFLVFFSCLIFQPFYFVSFSGVRFLNVTLGFGDASMSVDVLESCSAAEMFSDCRPGIGGVASTCEWSQAEWKRRSGEWSRQSLCSVACGWKWHPCSYHFLHLPHLPWKTGPRKSLVKRNRTCLTFFLFRMCTLSG